MMRNFRSNNSVRKTLLAAGATMLLACGALLPRPALGDLYDQAVQAEQEGVPEVSIQKLRTFLAAPETGKALPAKLLLARCLLATNQPAAALETLDGHALSSIEGQMLSAEALLRSGRWQEAATKWSKLLAEPNLGSSTVDARLGLAAAQEHLGAVREASETLAPLVQTPEPTDVRSVLMAAELRLELADYQGAQALLAKVRNPNRLEVAQKEALSGQVALSMNDLVTAETNFRDVLAFDVTQVSRIALIAQLGLTQIYIRQKEYEEAEAFIENIIGEQPQSSNLPDLFQTLYAIYLQEQTPSLAELTRWSQEDPKQVGSDRPILAQFYLGKLELKIGSHANGLKLLKDFVANHPTHALAGAAVAELAQQLELDAKVDEAISTAKEWLMTNPAASSTNRIAVEEELADALVQKGAFTEALDLYTHLGEGRSPNQARYFFNAAICALRLGDHQRYQQSLAALSSSSGNERERAALAFESAMVQAKTGDKLARDSFHRFLVDFSNDSQVPKAHLALAELAFTQSPPDRTRVISQLAQVNTTDPQTNEQKALLEFFTKADDRNEQISDIAQLAQDFLQKFPSSIAIPQVRIKLGEVYFRQNDYPNAQTQFELVAEEDPDSPLVETALFLAGEAARKSMNSSSMDHAISVFEEVYKLNGPLRYRARLEEALTMRQAAKDREAIVLLNDLLNQDIPLDIRCDALDAKGDALFTLAAKDEDQYREAIKTYDTLAALSGIPIGCKEGALYKKGKCYEKIKQPDEALATYYDVLNLDNDAPDEIWYFRAGFDAAQLLESKQSWASAAAIYQRLAAIPSARAEEARNRLTKLRLEHFLWPESASSHT
jgi:tetratricopeptide (TPR) repeat protein